MGKYIVLYHAPQSFAEAMANSTPEEMQKGMEAWMAWFAACGESVVDMGGPLGSSQRITTSGSSPNETTAIGYSVLQADDMAAAQALLASHPHIQWRDGCAIEVYEAMQGPS